MREILLSTQPKWCEKIGSGEKKDEVRKTRPKGQEPFKCFIYCTKADKKEQALLVDKNGRLSFGDYRNADNNDYYIANGKVIGEFICDFIDEFGMAGKGITMKRFSALYETRLSVDEMKKYANGKTTLYGWHISNLVIYDKPKELSEFFVKCNIPEKKCKWCDNCFEMEDSYGRYYAVKKLTRPPQSWQYVLEK